MRLVKVAETIGTQEGRENAKHIRVYCLRCDKSVALAKALADLDGPAFRAYYHEQCAPERSDRP